MPTALDVTRDGPVAVVTLGGAGGPAPFAVLHRALTAVWLDLEADPATRAVVLTGGGETFLSIAVEAEDARAPHEDEGVRTRVLAEARRIVLEMSAFPKPIIAAVNGPALGLGFSLAALSDLVLVAEEAAFGDTHLRAGLVAGDGVAMVLPHVVGPMRAKEILWTEERISAARAVELGIALRAVPRAALAGEAMSLALRVAAIAPQALQDTKRVLNLAFRQTLVGALELAMVAERQSLVSADHAAFLAGERNSPTPRAG